MLGGRRISMLSSEELEAVRQADLFQGLDEQRLAALVAGAVRRDYPRGALLFSQGERADRFYVVVDGWVKVYREGRDGAECLVGIFTRGQSFAEAAMFDRGCFPVNAMVSDDARVLYFPADFFLGRLQEDHELVLNLLAKLSRRLRAFVRQKEQLTTRPTYLRLAGFLLSLCPEGQNAATVRLPCDKLLIAGWLGMRPESFSRAMARLRLLNIRCEGNIVAIPDVHALRRFTHGGAPAPVAACGQVGCGG